MTALVGLVAGEQQADFRNSGEAVLNVDGDTNEPVGSVSRKDMRGKNLWHRASYVFVENCEGKFVVQIRSMTKEYCPGGYALATGGVMAPDETNELNAQRELEEELGIVKTVDDMKLIKQFKYANQRTSVWGNIFHIKLEDKAENLKLQEEEVSGVVYWTKEEIAEQSEKQKQDGYQGPLITPDGLEAFNVLI